MHDEYGAPLGGPSGRRSSAIKADKPWDIGRTLEEFVNYSPVALDLLHNLLHRADETQKGRNSCPRLQFLAFSLDSIMSLPCAFYVVSALHHCLLFFLFWLIRSFTDPT